MFRIWRTDDFCCVTLPFHSQDLSTLIFKCLLTLFRAQSAYWMQLARFMVWIWVGSWTIEWTRPHTNMRAPSKTDARICAHTHKPGCKKGSTRPDRICRAHGGVCTVARASTHIHAQSYAPTQLRCTWNEAAHRIRSSKLKMRTRKNNTSLCAIITHVTAWLSSSTNANTPWETVA